MRSRWRSSSLTRTEYQPSTAESVVFKEACRSGLMILHVSVCIVFRECRLVQ